MCSMPSDRQRGAHADHVEDRIECPDLVQLDGVGCDAVDRALDLGQRPVHGRPRDDAPARADSDDSISAITSPPVGA